MLESLQNLAVNKSDNVKEDISAENVRDFFINYHLNKEAAEGNVSEENENDIEMNEEEEEKKEIPLHIKMVEQV